MDNETLDAYMMDLLADEATLDAMEHMEESGFSDIEDAAHAMGCRITTTGLMEETLANLPQEVLTMSWHRSKFEDQWVEATFLYGGRTYEYPWETSGVNQSYPPFLALMALERWIQKRDLALPDGDCITVSR